MPRAISEADLADAELPLDELAAAIVAEAGDERRAATPAHDDYVEFCEGVRRLTGIDLTQYKRPQMERRDPLVRRAPRRRRRWPPTSQRAGERAGRARTSFLDRSRSTSPSSGATPSSGTRLADRSSPELAETGPDPQLERRLLVRRRGVHAGRRLPQTVAPEARARDPRHGHRRAHGRARPRGPCSRSTTRAARRPAQLERWFDARAGRLAGQGRSCAMLTRFETGDLLRDRFRAGRVRPGALPQRRHLLHRAGPRRAARPARRVAAPRRLPRGRLHRARRRPGRASGSSPSIPSSTGSA